MCSITNYFVRYLGIPATFHPFLTNAPTKNSLFPIQGKSVFCLSITWAPNRVISLRVTVGTVALHCLQNKSESPHKNLDCHGWSECNIICLGLCWCNDISPAQNPNISRCICCNRDRICFYADIRIVFGTVCTLTKALLWRHQAY